MSLYHKNKKINRVGFVGFGLSNSTLYSILKRDFPSLSFSFRLPYGEPREFMERCYLGGDYLKDIDEDVLFFSPSVKRPNDSETAIFSSECEFFFEGYGNGAFLVSGSDGKSTTATIASEILKPRSILCGNIGTPACLFYKEKQRAVVELSSFQLNYFAPHSHSAVLSSLSENHLDFHASFENYVSAKENLLKNATRKALWLDTELERTLARRHKAESVLSYEKSFSALRTEFDAQNYLTVKDGAILLNGEPYANAERIYQFGDYTVKNLMSAIALTLGEDGDVQGAIDRFTPLEERCTPVLERNGIKYYSSSIDSSPLRTATTLSRFSDNVILILGGRGKGLDYSPLKDAIRGRVKSVYLYGEDGEKMLCALNENSDISFKYCFDFEACVLNAIKNAKSGDSVLLSPAATSYDQFENYKKRGEEFKRIINKI